MDNQGIGQQQGYEQWQMNYGQSQQPMAPKKQVNKKAIIVFATILVVAILALIFVPKLINTKDPFARIRLGCSSKTIMRQFDIDKEDVHNKDLLIADLEGFDVKGEAWFYFGDDKLEVVYWFVEMMDFDDWYAYREFKPAVLDYYTKKYGEPIVSQLENDETAYTWFYDETGMVALQDRGTMFVLIYR